MEALRELGESRVRVRRDGQEREVDVSQLVPGDTVLQEGGDVVPADLRLVEANNLRVDESPLTGESVAAIKRAEPDQPDAALAERHSMLFRGTTVTEGSAEAVVVATGMQTELGRVADRLSRSNSRRRLDSSQTRSAKGRDWPGSLWERPPSWPWSAS